MNLELEETSWMVLINEATEWTTLTWSQAPYSLWCGWGGGCAGCAREFRPTEYMSRSKLRPRDGHDAWCAWNFNFKNENWIKSHAITLEFQFFSLTAICAAGILWVESNRHVSNLTSGWAWPHLTKWYWRFSGLISRLPQIGHTTIFFPTK